MTQMDRYIYYLGQDQKEYDFKTVASAAELFFDEDLQEVCGTFGKKLDRHFSPSYIGQDPPSRRLDELIEKTCMYEEDMLTLRRAACLVVRIILFILIAVSIGRYFQGLVSLTHPFLWGFLLILSTEAYNHYVHRGRFRRWQRLKDVAVSMLDLDNIDSDINIGRKLFDEWIRRRAFTFKQGLWIHVRTFAVFFAILGLLTIIFRGFLAFLLVLLIFVVFESLFILTGMFILSKLLTKAVSLAMDEIDGCEDDEDDDDEDDEDDEDDDEDDDDDEDENEDDDNRSTDSRPVSDHPHLHILPKDDELEDFDDAFDDDKE